MRTNIVPPRVPFTDVRTGTISREWYRFLLVLFENAGGATGVVPVDSGGTGLTSGTSGGVLGFTAATVIASSVALTANQIVLGGGAGATPIPLGSLGTATTVLHGNAAGAPSFSPVSLTADVTGILPLANGGTNAALVASNGGVVYSDSSALAINTPGTSGNWLKSAGVSAPTWTAPAALSRVDDTNVTLTLGGSPTTALLNAASLTLGWTGQLGLTRGGTAASLVAANGGVVYSTAAALAINSPGSNGDWLKSSGAGAPAWTNPATLSKVDDTNVTLTLGGSPTTALLNAASITAGWTGQLGLTRGGTAASLVAANGGVVYSTAAALAINTPGSSGDWLRSAGAGAPAWTGPAALTRTDDTNVTLTLGGSASTALLNAASLTLGWTGQLGLTRGGTAASLVASNGGIVYSGAAALAILSGTATAGQILRSGASAAPSWSTPTFPNTATSNKALVGDGTNIVLSTPTIPLTSSPSAGVILRGDGTNWVASTPTYPNSATSNKALVGDGTNVVLSTPTIPLTSSPSANKVMVGDGTNWVASTPTVPLTSSPSSGKILIGDGTNWVASTPTWPTASPGAGTFPRGDGTNFATSTLTLPNTITANRIPYATGSNAIGDSASLTFDGTTLTASVASITGSAGLTVNNTGSQSTLTISDAAASSYSRAVLRGGSGHYAFAIGVQDLINDALTIAPSTATGGTTFTTSVLTVNQSGAIQFPGITTTASAANAFLDSGASNSLLRSTSSIRYKPSVRPLELDEARAIVLDSKPVAYVHESGAEGVGFLAEHEVKDRRMVTFDKFGRPDWVQYPHYTAPLALIAQDHERRLQAAGL